MKRKSNEYEAQFSLQELKEFLILVYLIKMYVINKKKTGVSK